VIYFDEYVKQLQQASKYQGKWKNIFLQMKLRKMRGYYFTISKKYKPQMLDAIRKNIGQDERDFLSSNDNDLPWYITNFYSTLDGSRIAQVICVFANILRSIRRIVLKTTTITIHCFDIL
jgi:hypothetical protein